MQTGKPAPSFSERLHAEQQDLYQINTFLDDMVALQKQMKHNKIKWRILSYTMHAVAISSGALTLYNAYEHNHSAGIIWGVAMILTARFGFINNNIYTEFKKIESQVKEIRGTVETYALNATTPQDIEQIADIIREARSQLDTQR